MALMVLAATTAQADVLLVAGSPGYDQNMATGLKDGGVLTLPGSGVNNSGTAVGFSIKYDSGSEVGERAVRWDASGTAATELGNLGAYNSSTTEAKAFAVNDVGTAVGRSTKYVSGSWVGERAVRWDASGTAATELGNLGTGGYGGTDARAYAVNNAGTAVGRSNKYASGSYKGRRAVRWDASGTAATELGNLGTDGSSFTNAEARAVNDSGTAVGNSDKYVNGSSVGDRAVRWDASGTAATELDNLGTTISGYTEAYAYAVNDAGTAVGFSRKYVNGSSVGYCAVRWDASGTAATELGNLGTHSNGNSFAQAYAVNDVGTTVGYSRKYISGSNVGSRAVVWLPDASAVDLNDLGVVPVPAGGTWTLTSAKALSADGWVAGQGRFDPDGAGTLGWYSRHWVAQVGLGGTWTKAGGGTWGRGPNWSTGTPAMQVGDATFDLDATYTVALDRDELTKTMALDAGTVSIDFGGHTLGTESGLSIADAATLKGAGTIDGDITSAGTIAPGNSPGTLDIDGDLASSGTLEFEIAGLASHDQINVIGEFTASGTIEVMLDGYTPLNGESFGLMSFGSFIDDGYVFDFTQAGLSPGLEWDTAAFATTGSIGVVPEPSTLALLAAGSIALLAFARRRRK